MRISIVLCIALMLAATSFYAFSSPSKNTVDELRDHSSEVAARYHYRQRRGAIYRR